MLIAKNIKGFEVYTSCADMHGKKTIEYIRWSFSILWSLWRNARLARLWICGFKSCHSDHEGYNLRVKQGPPEPLMWVQFPPSTYTCSLKGFTNNM